MTSIVNMYLQTISKQYFVGNKSIWNWKEPWPLLPKSQFIKRKARLSTGCVKIRENTTDIFCQFRNKNRQVLYDDFMKKKSWK